VQNAPHAANENQGEAYPNDVSRISLYVRK